MIKKMTSRKVLRGTTLTPFEQLNCRSGRAGVSAILIVVKHTAD